MNSKFNNVSDPGLGTVCVSVCTEGALIGVMRGNNDDKLPTELLDLSLFNEVNEPWGLLFTKYSLRFENSGATCGTCLPTSGEVLNDGVAELAVDMVLAVLKT